MLPPLESIQCFIAISQFKNFRLAASSVALTPAALSKRIKLLEEQLGKKLFHRSTRKVSLTKAGQDLLPVAHKLIQTAQECIFASHSENKSQAPLKLTLGVRHEEVVNWVLPMMLKLREIFPNLHLDVYAAAGPEIEHKLKVSEIDLAIMCGEIVDHVIDSIPMQPETFLFTASPELLKKVPFDKVEQSRDHCLIDVSPDLPLLRYLKNTDDALKPNTFKKLWFVSTVQGIHYLVLKGEGVAILPYSQIRNDLKQGKLVVLFPQNKLKSPYSTLFFRRQDPRTNFYVELAKEIKNLYL